MESKLSSQIELHSGDETPCLPEQVIVGEILPRLPAKSLLKFRCVAKSWCSLIGSKKFIKAHLKKSIKNSWFSHRCIFFDFADTKFKQCGLPPLLDKPFTAPIAHISDLGIHKYDLISPVGFCNGLVCILINSRKFILLNPTTKKFKYLPLIYNQIQYRVGTCGFGFDESADDYKVFGVVNAIQLTGPPPYCIGMVYSLRSNSWKRIEDNDQVPPIDGEGKGINVSGKLHWNDNRGGIVSFDLNSHVSSVVELPRNAKGVLRRLGVIGGCLSAYFFHPNGDLDFWLMKEYVVNESWSKVVTVPYYNHLENPAPSNSDIPNPVAIAPNGEVLLIHHSTIVIYNPKCDVLRHSQIATNEGFCYLGIYIDSLASVASYAQ